MAATLDAFLNSHARSSEAGRGVAAEVVRAIAGAAVRVRTLLGQASPFPAVQNEGAVKTGLDAEAEELFLEALRAAPVAYCFSARSDAPTVLEDPNGLAVAIVPLDAVASMDINAPVGTLFSIRPGAPYAQGDPRQPFLSPGRSQRGGGFVIYGPRLLLVVTLGSGTHTFAFSSRLGAFIQVQESHVIQKRAHDLAIDASNYRHWHEPVRLYVDDVLKGSEGPRERDLGMRWSGSLVAEAYRILVHGGVFLDPADRRKGMSRGHLRLVHEACPIALLVEQAGGRATDAISDILDLQPLDPGDKTALVFGASREVTRIARYHDDPGMLSERAPLFGNRGLFRA